MEISKCIKPFMLVHGKEVSLRFDLATELFLQSLIRLVISPPKFVLS